MWLYVLQTFFQTNSFDVNDFRQRILFYFTLFCADYPDYSQQDYSQYAGQVKYESGDEQKYRPADQGNGSYEYRSQDY